MAENRDSETPQEASRWLPKSGPGRLIALLAATIVAGSLVIALIDPPVFGFLARLVVAACGLLLLLWAVWRLWRIAMWRVGRRLAFSYLLTGALPIPLVMLLLALVTYILCGFFLGHLYRDVVGDVHTEMAIEAGTRLAALAGGGRVDGGGDGAAVAFAAYRGGRRVGGDERLPAAWPAWVAGDEGGRDAARFFAVGNEAPTLAVTAGDAALGVLAVYAGDLALELSERSGVWVRLAAPETMDERQGTDGEAEGEAESGGAGGERASGGAGEQGAGEERRVTVEALGRQLTLRTDPRRTSGGAEDFFAARATSDADSPWLARMADEPFLWWAALPGPLDRLADGAEVANHFSVELIAPPRTIGSHLFAGSPQVDAPAWAVVLVFGVLLLNVYLFATLMAAILIFALTRAVNRLSHATERVRGGDFSVRIPVKRKDQIGELQRSFNTMAENLEQLVATATQKELLEKELAIARDLQESLVPHDLPASEAIAFATVFEPSAAIGGDYFDVLRLSEDRLAVIVADVSGHGLPTGLRMAMLKSALTILVAEDKPVGEILDRLDQVARLDGDGRFFVTATLALVDFANDRLELTNAGHPPTYLVRGDGVREVLLPSSPLGGLGRDWGHETLALEAGDVVVWLSDGFIEALDADDEPFGYHGIEATLRQAAEDAATAERLLTVDEVKARLVAAVAAHAGGRPAEDDRTLLVMRYR
jgi:serine phosphatase RsbU (regulator of sigma subunit)